MQENFGKIKKLRKKKLVNGLRKFSVNFKLNLGKICRKPVVCAMNAEDHTACIGMQHGSGRSESRRFARR